MGLVKSQVPHIRPLFSGEGNLMARFLRLPTFLAIGLIPALAITVAGVLFAGGLARPASAAVGGPVVLMGIDAEDGGVGGHGPISVYGDVVSRILAEVKNGGPG